ncbi:MAG: hypothetical protein D3904_11420 [Candidatus Electrothrix sp. EH2]|nr:hypothetical protein [Candidatus Electrothrix sp. EH2]
MKVANPLYDVVFKYLMQDMRVAKLVISNILEQEIASLGDFYPGGIYDHSPVMYRRGQKNSSYSWKNL